MTNEHPSPEGAQDEALRLADALDGGKLIDDSTEWADTLHAAAAMLRSLHIEVTEQARLLGISGEREMALRARVQELERQLSAIGAGGVEPLRRRADPDLAQLTARGAVAWAGVDAQALRDGEGIRAMLAAAPKAVQPSGSTGWLAWGGTAVPPVSGETVVEVKSHDLEPSVPLPARDWDWTLVAAYRLAPKAAPNPAAQGDALDAARYRWLRDQNNSLESYDYVRRQRNGPSCYHRVGGVRELKSGPKLDAAIDAARAAKEGGVDA